MPIIRSWYDEMLGRQKQWFSHNECFDMSNTLAQLGRALTEMVRGHRFNSCMCYRLHFEVDLNYYLEL